MKLEDILIFVVLLRFVISLWEGSIHTWNSQLNNNTNVQDFAQPEANPWGEKELQEVSDNETITEDDSSKSKDQFSKDTNENCLDYVLFYHIFIAKNDKQAATEVIPEQMDQIGTSWAAQNARKENKNLTLHAYIVGPFEDPIKSSFWDKCKEYSLNCITKQFTKGYEPVTLNDLHQYCQSNPNKRVIYVHSKGTFHARKYQQKWREALTESALLETCIRPPNKKCNLCGLSFQPFWSLFIPGNMWSADCEYISKLIPISELEARMPNITAAGKELGLQTNLYSEKQTKQSHDSIYGLGRFVAEHWVATHPDVQPCEQAPYTNIPWIWIKRKQFPPNDWSFQMAPRFNLTENPMDWTGFMGGSNQQFKAVMRSEANALKEYCFLAGLIWKWHHLYNSQMPVDDSWIWKYYPDGDVWKAAVKVYGPSQAITMVLKQPEALDMLSSFRMAVFNQLEILGKNMQLKSKTEGRVL